MSQDYLVKLEHIRGAVAHHVFELESAGILAWKGRAEPAKPPFRLVNVRGRAFDPRF
jgi:hypothetical protein